MAECTPQRLQQTLADARASRVTVERPVPASATPDVKAEGPHNSEKKEAIVDAQA